jgi:hypothetical protein
MRCIALSPSLLKFKPRRRFEMKTQEKMIRFGLTAVVLAVGVLLWSSSAYAEGIRLSGTADGSAVVQVLVDNSSSPVNFQGMCCTDTGDDWSILANASGFPDQKSGTFLTDSIDLKTTGAGSLFLWFTQSGLTSPLGKVDIHSGLTSNFEVGGVTSARLDSYFSATNGVAPPVGSLLLEDTFSGTGTMEGTKTVTLGPGPYSLQAGYKVVASGPGSANLTINITTSEVPEPSSMLLLGSGVLGLAGVLRRKLCGGRS